MSLILCMHTVATIIPVIICTHVYTHYTCAHAHIIMYIVVNHKYFYGRYILVWGGIDILLPVYGITKTVFNIPQYFDQIQLRESVCKECFAQCLPTYV